jgi:hypothetical protein
MNEQQRLAEDKEAAAATATATAFSQSAHARTKDAASKLLAKASGRAVTAAIWMMRACEAEQHAFTHQGNLAAHTAEISKLEGVCLHAAVKETSEMRYANALDIVTATT